MPTLTLSGTVHVAKSADQLLDDLALDLAAAAGDAIKARGVFHLALSGGSTPEPFYERLVIDPRYRTLPWERTHLWIVDERRVPEDHEKSNWRMIKSTLVDHVPLKKRGIHPMRVMLPDPATAYEAELREAFPDHAKATPRMDWVLLGMGDDAHTASLFPRSAALNVADRWIVVNEGAHVTPPDRVTMTYPLLNAARSLAVLCVGAKKTATLRKVDAQLRKGADIQTMPVTGIQPTDGELTWFMDAPAAG